MHVDVPPGKRINGFTGELEDAEVVALDLSPLEQRKIASGDMSLSEAKSPEEYEDPEGRHTELGESFIAPPEDDFTQTKDVTPEEEQPAPTKGKATDEKVQSTKRARSTKK